MKPEELWNAFVAMIAKACWPLLDQVFRRRGYSRADIEDACSVVVERLIAWKWKAYFLKAVENELRSMGRKRSRLKGTGVLEEVAGPSSALVDPGDLETIGSCARRCRPQRMAVVRLTVSAELKPGTVASLLGIKASSVPVLKSRGLQELREEYRRNHRGGAAETSAWPFGRYGGAWEPLVSLLLDRIQPFSPAVSRGSTREILTLWLAWWTDEQIADRLQVTSGTVQAKINEVLGELREANLASRQ